MVSARSRRARWAAPNGYGSLASPCATEGSRFPPRFRGDVEVRGVGMRLLYRPAASWWCLRLLGSAKTARTAVRHAKTSSGTARRDVSVIDICAGLDAENTNADLGAGGSRRASFTPVRARRGAFAERGTVSRLCPTPPSSAVNLGSRSSPAEPAGRRTCPSPLPPPPPRPASQFPTRDGPTAPLGAPSNPYPGGIPRAGPRR
jgi:hypothetical protein